MDIKDCSCSDLQKEIARRRSIEISKIKNEYTLLTDVVKDKYLTLRNLVELDPTIIENIQRGSWNDMDRYPREDSERRLRQLVYEYERHQVPLEELFLGFLSVPMNVTPKDVIDMAERGSILSLEAERDNKISKLY